MHGIRCCLPFSADWGLSWHDDMRSVVAADLQRMSVLFFPQYFTVVSFRFIPVQGYVGPRPISLPNSTGKRCRAKLLFDFDEPSSHHHHDHHVLYPATSRSCCSNKILPRRAQLKLIHRLTSFPIAHISPAPRVSWQSHHFDRANVNLKFTHRNVSSKRIISANQINSYHIKI